VASEAAGPVPPSPSHKREDRQGRHGTPLNANCHLRKERELCKQAVAAACAVASHLPVRGGAAPGPTAANSSGLDFYALGKPLGKGAFGKVNVAVHKLTEELTAMKLCERRKIVEVQAKKCLNQEVIVLTHLNGHPNVIQLFEVVETMTHVVLVMEFAAGGDLLRFVRKSGRLAEPCARVLFKQLMDGLVYIHRLGVVHRDIKLENLLLDCHTCVKIADFGVAALVKAPGQQLTEHCGTPSYIAPEILLEAGYDGPPVDVWSSGVVLYAMLCGRVPFKGDQFSELKRSILSGRFTIPPKLSTHACALLRAMLVVDPVARITLEGCVGHGWIAGVPNRAEEIHNAAGAPPLSQAAAGSEGFRVSRHLCAKVVACGFPQPFVEESLRDGRLNHATATYHLLAKQEVRRRATKFIKNAMPQGIGCSVTVGAAGFGCSVTVGAAGMEEAAAVDAEDAGGGGTLGAPVGEPTEGPILGEEYRL